MHYMTRFLTISHPQRPDHSVERRCHGPMYLHGAVEVPPPHCSHLALDPPKLEKVGGKSSVHCPTDYFRII